jgi:hypothetical protein
MARADAVNEGGADAVAEGVADTGSVRGPAALLHAVAKRPTTRAIRKARMGISVAAP